MNTFGIAQRSFAAALIMSLLLALLPIGALASIYKGNGDSSTEVLPLTVSEESGLIASGTCGDHVYWSLDTLGTLAISGKGDMHNYSTGTLQPWHPFRGGITNVIIGEGVSSIGDRVFLGCNTLTSITIPDGVNSIGNSAFYSCINLTSINIPETVSSIGSLAFDGCWSLADITIPEGVTSIGEWAFDSCGSLTSVTIPKSMVSIGEGAFYNCTSLTSITILEGVTSIGNRAFWCCGSLTSITIPKGVTSIETETFYNCTSLTSITIPESVTGIGNYAFHNCYDLGHVLYTGTEGQWNAISVGTNNGYLANATCHYSSTGNEITSVVSKGPTCTVDGEQITTCTVCGDTHTEVLPAQGHKIENGICVACGYRENLVVTGNITAFGAGEVTLVLTEVGKDQPLNTVTTDAQDYTLDVLPGTYVLMVSKPHHVPRQYTTTVATEVVSLDIKICLFGDINGDGLVNVADTARAYGHVKGSVSLTDYSLACGDVDDNGKLNVGDISKIYAHVKGAKSLW